jgi:Membrane-fusion protein
MNNKSIWLPLFFVSLLSLFALAESDHDHDDHDHDHEHSSGSSQHQHSEDHEHGHDHDHPEAVVLSADMAAAAGITVAQAGPGEVAHAIEVFGRLVIPAEKRARIQARYPGVVAQVGVNAGDRVVKGQVLATIESNDSLRPYDIKSPVDGWVQSRVANIGESTGENPLFEVIDDRQLWAELKIFPRNRAAVTAGQTVHLLIGDTSVQGEVAALLPAAESTPFVIARVPLNNSDRQLIAGDLAQAQIIIDARTAPLVVANRALQIFEEKPVVFVREGNIYEPRPLVLGRSDGRFTEVLEGLQQGETYVVDNSYLLKADLEKAGAAHQH